MRIIGTSLLVCLFALGCGDDGDDKSKGGGKANAAVRSYCAAQCGRNDECGIENELFQGEDCIAICEGFTTAFGDCNPSTTVRDACIAALKARSCDEVENDEDDPRECDAFCE